MEIILKNIMWFALILLLLALTVAVVQVIIILVEVKGSVRELSKRLKSFMLGAVIAGLKKGFQVLTGGEK